MALRVRGKWGARRLDFLGRKLPRSLQPKSVVASRKRLKSVHVLVSLTFVRNQKPRLALPPVEPSFVSKTRERIRDESDEVESCALVLVLFLESSNKA